MRYCSGTPMESFPIPNSFDDMVTLMCSIYHKADKVTLGTW